uniref:Nitrate regulatory gene2 protein n=1 Tax=Kalanchoe fedtschenkoi TaxID=63787 RepID=A0A7N0VJ12_KALFE
MGCSASKIEKDDKVRACKERIGLIKQLLVFREEFATAQLAYLRSLKNTGATLRQFTDAETLEVEGRDFELELPPSPPPPPPLPPSPPPPPTFSPELRNSECSRDVGLKDYVDLMVDEDEDFPILPPPRIEDWERWHPFEPSASSSRKKNETDNRFNAENENGRETSIEIEGSDQEEIVCDTDMADKDLSLMGWYAKQKTKTTMAVRMESKPLTLAGTTKEMDEYFLKASAFGTELAVLMDTKNLGILHLEENKRKKSNPAKVFSALSWSRSSKSLHVTRDTDDPFDPSRPGAHCVTLEKLYTEEQKLYKDLKQEEITKLELQRKTSFLQRQEEEDPEWEHIGKTRLNVERLQSDVSCLEQSITDTCSSILKLIENELQCQLIILTTGLMHMWRTMYECHQIQNQLSQQINNLNNPQRIDPTSEYHRQATTQLENELRFWYDNFNELVKSQRDFVTTLGQWLRLAKHLLDDQNQNDSLPIVCKLCEDWQLALDSLLNKVVSEAIKGFLSAIQSIALQQEDEQLQLSKLDKLSKRLIKEQHLLAEMEARHEGGRAAFGDTSPVDPKHPISVKRTKVEAMKKEVDIEKAKYLSLVKLSHAMTQSKLKTSLPTVFHALMEYSLACAENLEAMYDHNEPSNTKGPQQVT